MENYELMARESMGTDEPKVKNESREKVQRTKTKHMGKKLKIIVIVYSHTRGCAAEIKLKLDEGFEVQGFVNPGTGVNTISTCAKMGIQRLSKQDVVWGGSKDVGKNETKKSINCIQRLVKTNNHTNFILMDIPHRYDLEQISCVNKEVEKYNRRIRKHMKVFENTAVIKVDVDRSGFTKHCQHMNAKGKELMAKRRAAATKHALKVCKRTPISMKCKEDPSKENHGLGEAEIGVGG
jgi:hypothetical protein